MEDLLNILIRGFWLQLTRKAVTMDHRHLIMICLLQISLIVDQNTTKNVQKLNRSVREVHNEVRYTFSWRFGINCCRFWNWLVFCRELLETLTLLLLLLLAGFGTRGSGEWFIKYSRYNRSNKISPIFACYPYQITDLGDNMSIWPQGRSKNTLPDYLAHSSASIWRYLGLSHSQALHNPSWLQERQRVLLLQTHRRQRLQIWIVGQDDHAQYVIGSSNRSQKSQMWIDNLIHATKNNNLTSRT